MPSLLDKLQKGGAIKGDLLPDSEAFKNNFEVVTNYPMINVALSGSLDGGLQSGITMIAGPSKHFKTLFGLLLCSEYMREFEDAYLLFYDSEKGASLDYFDTVGIDPKRVFHIPTTDIGVLSNDLVKRLNEDFNKGDRIIVLIDSVGNLASPKEIADAISGSDKADMTRAKLMKSLGRMITPHLKFKDIPLIAINHTYKEIGPMYPKDVVSGGTGFYYSSDDVWVIGRRQTQDSERKLLGFEFIINIDKSRSTKEKSQIPIEVTFEHGISKYSGLFPLLLEFGYVHKAKKGWYNVMDPETGEIDPVNKREKEIKADFEYLDKVLKDENFRKRVLNRYKMADEDEEEPLEDHDD